uniref:Uncharacterized protein n=1 Tax=Podarcis muralis TaxID=64176 RepID=A0A670HQZ5_PODMU
LFSPQSLQPWTALVFPLAVQLLSWDSWDSRLSVESKHTPSCDRQQSHDCNHGAGILTSRSRRLLSGRSAESIEKMEEHASEAVGLLRRVQKWKQLQWCPARRMPRKTENPLDERVFRF